MKKKLSYLFSLFKRKKLYILLMLFFFSMGIFFLLLKRGRLIFQWSYADRGDNLSVSSNRHVVRRKKNKLFYWKNDRLFYEESSFILLSDVGENVKTVLSAWLSFLYEERILEKVVRLESVLLADYGQKIYISFNQIPFGKEWSINKKWKLLDGLCRTISYSDINIQSIVFCVRHEPMNDVHLDFSLPWQISSYDSNF